MHVGMGVTTMEGMWSQLRGWHLGVGGGSWVRGFGYKSRHRGIHGEGGGQEVGVPMAVVGSHERRWSVQAAAIAPVWGCGDVGCGDVGT